MNGDQGNNRFLSLGTAPGRHPKETVTILRCPVNPGTAPRIDPQMKAVTVIQPRVTTPGQLPFSVDQNVNPDSCRTPPHPNIRKYGSIGQGTEGGQTACRGQLQPTIGPFARVLVKRHRESEQESRID
jgi:hypothetical protein